MTTVRIVGPEVRVNTTTPGNEINPVVAPLVGGGYVISWTAEEGDGSGGGVYAQRYTADGIAVGAETRINSTTASNQLDPAVTALADGCYVITWRSNAPGQDGSGFGIYSQRYDASGVAVGGEVRVNTTTASDQVYPSIAALSDGGYVVT